ncbi:MAG: hypothetical protein J5582_02910 [Ruminococcus sp.]|uniref:hypothetical protein n=1 Tax=Ruminococcus sp. TaxID=41978 RepID=UPI0025F6DED6|nr:hypothetical protein [Ruminococcus sp.]MBO4865511.1 hypothetical protein [Ruminococcus sp.]
MDLYEIIPGKSVGRYNIGANYDSIIELLSTENILFRTADNNYEKKIITADIVFWFEEEALIQIMVCNDFKGKVNGKVGIGSYLSDVEKYIGKPEDSGQIIETVYMIKDVPGISFGLQDNDIDDEWDEKTAPIENIFVFE